MSDIRKKTILKKTKVCKTFKKQRKLKNFLKEIFCFKNKNIFNAFSF